MWVTIGTDRVGGDWAPAITADVILGQVGARFNLLHTLFIARHYCQGLSGWLPSCCELVARDDGPSRACLLCSKHEQVRRQCLLTMILKQLHQFEQHVQWLVKYCMQGNPKLKP